MKEHALTDSNFDKETTACKTPYMVEFFATWCGHCQHMAPVIKEVAKEMDGRVKVFIADVDEAPKTTSDFNVSGTPTMILFKNNKTVKEIVGERAKEDLIEALEALL